MRIIILMLSALLSTGTPTVEEPNYAILEGPTEMHQLYKELALNIENMDIALGLEGIKEDDELVDIIEAFTGEKVCIEYGYDSFKEEGEKYIIETLGKGRQNFGEGYRVMSITITDKETDESIFIIRREDPVPERGGTILYPCYDNSMEIRYSGFDYNVESFRYDYEEETIYNTAYELYTIETTYDGHEYESYHDTIEKEYDNVNEVFDILYK